MADTFTTPPAIPEVIVRWLEALFPNRVPDLSDSDREVWASVGRQDVIKKLRSEYTRQTENLLET